MPDVPAPLPPGSSGPPIDRAAVERVLARAAELQSATGDTPDQMTEAQLLDVGREVGLSPQHLRQALAEERTRSLVPDRERGVLARLIGAGHVQAGRTVSGKPAGVLSTIDSWMQREELLQVKRHLADRIVWEPRRDLLGSLRRALNVGGRGYALTRAFEVAATVVAVDDAHVHVSLAADLTGHRTRLSEEWGAMTALSAAATGVLAVIGIAAVAAAVPIVVVPPAALYGLRSMQARSLTRSQLALEQVLDRLERGEVGRQPSLLGAIVRP